MVRSIAASFRPAAIIDQRAELEGVTLPFRRNACRSISTKSLCAMSFSFLPGVAATENSLIRKRPSGSGRESRLKDDGRDLRLSLMTTG